MQLVRDKMMFINYCYSDWKLLGLFVFGILQAPGRRDLKRMGSPRRLCEGSY